MTNTPCPIPFRVSTNSGLRSVASSSWLYVAHITCLIRDFPVLLCPWAVSRTCIILSPTSSFTSHAQLSRGQPSSVSFAPQVLHCYSFFSTYGSCHKLSSSVKYQHKTQHSPPSCPIPEHQTLSCTDSLPYANNKHGTEIEQGK